MGAAETGSVPAKREIKWNLSLRKTCDVGRYSFHCRGRRLAVGNGNRPAPIEVSRLQKESGRLPVSIWPEGNTQIATV